MKQTRHNIIAMAFVFGLLVLVTACSGQVSPTAASPAATNTTVPVTQTVLAAPTLAPTPGPTVVPTAVNNPPTTAPTNVPTATISRPSVGPTATPGSTAPRTITLADDGKTINLQLGDRFVLDLGSGYNWKATIDNPSIVGPASDATHPGAPVYQAKQPGTSSLHATGDPPCLYATPRCLLPSRLFQIKIVVTSSVPAAQTITLDDDGTSITIQAGQTFLLNLGDGFNWTVTVDDPTIVSRVPNITVVKGAQGVYQANKPGTTTLHATGIIVCPPLQACPQLARAFRVQIVVK